MEGAAKAAVKRRAATARNCILTDVDVVYNEKKYYKRSEFEVRNEAKLNLASELNERAGKWKLALY